MKQNKLEKIAKTKMLKQQHNHNELHRYCRMMDTHLDWGFFYYEAKNYVKGLLRR